MFEMTLETIEERLGATRVGRLCMASSGGEPYAIPMPFCWMDGAIYMRIPMSGRKGQLLAENPRVCFEIDWHTDTLDDYGSVIVEGVMESVSDLAEKARVRGQNNEKYGRLRKGYRPGHGRVVELEKLSMQKIVVSRVSGRQKFPAQGTDEMPAYGQALVAAAGGGCEAFNSPA